MRLSLAVATALLAGVACSNSHNPATDGSVPPLGKRIPDEVPPGADRLQTEPVHEEAYSGIGESRRAVVRTQAEWRGLWDELAGRQIPRPEPPEIAFDRRMVVVATMGTRPTGGYTIEIEGVHAAEDRVYVEVVEKSPGAGCLTTQALTAPAVAVAVEVRSGEATFLEREATHDCE